MDWTLSSIINPHFTGWLLVFKIFCFLLFFGFLGFIIFALIRTTWFRRVFLWDMQEFMTYRAYGTRRMEKQWAKVKARLQAGTESEYKLAIIEADSMMDDILKRMGYGGSSLGERLEKLTSATLHNISDVGEAHKIRNNIVHDPDYRLSLDEVKDVIAIFEKALVNLQAL
ncbi:MAG: hypothetical protein WC514_03385 [Candidatus Paceibacterota bacterium]